MNKRLLTFLLLLLASASAFAQLRHEQQSQIGLRAGVAFSSFDSGLDNTPGVREFWMPGLTAGIATSFWSARKHWFAFAPEVNYNQRGYKVEVVDDLGSRTYSNKYHFVEVPLLFRATFGRQILRGYINMGPSVSYLLGGKEETNLYGVTKTTKIEAEDERYNYFEVAGAFGGGLHINTGIGNFLVDFRYYTAFTDVYTDDYQHPAFAGIAAPPESFKSQYFSASLIFLGPYRK